MKKLDFLKPALPLTIISIAIALILALVNALTADKIVENARIEKENAIKSVFTECETFTNIEAEATDSIINEIGKAFDANGQILGYYADVSPIGFKDAINLIVGTDEQGNVIKAVLVSSSETPGVGTKATAEEYLQRYAGLNTDTINDVETITGATISSKTVKLGINVAASAIENAIKEGK